MKAFKNIILIVALSAVIVMIIAILLYDFIPSSSAVAEPNIYTQDTTTTKVLSQIAEDSETLGISDDETKSSIVLKSYSITETDLALYAATSSYDKGKADPFAEYTITQATGESGNTSSSSSSSTETSGSTTTANSSTTTTSSDGTLFNSTSSK